MKKFNFILVLLFCLLGYRVTNAGIFDSLEEEYKKAYISWYMCSCKQLYSDDCAKLDNKEQLLAQKLRLKDYTWKKIEILRNIAKLENNLPKDCTSPYQKIINNIRSLGLEPIDDNFTAFDPTPLRNLEYFNKNMAWWYIFSLEDIKRIHYKKVIPYKYGIIEKDTDNVDNTVALTFEQLQQYISPYVSKKTDGHKFFNIEDKELDKKFDINFINDLNSRYTYDTRLLIDTKYYTRLLIDTNQVEKFSKKYQLPIQHNEYELIDYLIKNKIISDLPVIFLWANE